MVENVANYVIYNEENLEERESRAQIERTERN